MSSYITDRVDIEYAVVNAGQDAIFRKHRYPRHIQQRI